MKGCFLILLLTLIAPLLTFAQEPLRVEDVKALRLKAAESEAKKDADKDMRKASTFYHGYGVSLSLVEHVLLMTFRALPFWRTRRLDALHLLCCGGLAFFSRRLITTTPRHTRRLKD